MSGEHHHDGHPYHMAQMPEGERIAMLEANERNTGRELHAIRLSLAALTLNLAEVNKTLNEMSGGKKAVMGIFGLIGAAIGVFGTLFAMFAHNPFGKS